MQPHLQHKASPVLINRFLRKWEAYCSWKDTCLARLFADFLGIGLGDRCRFHGRPLFRRAEDSHIEIGSDCSFRSALRWTGQAGISRPTTIQTLRPGARIRVGNRCGFSGTVVAAAESVELGEHVLCGANVTITDTDWHHVNPDQRSAPHAPSAPVTIGDNVWLGINVIVLKGVTIGSNTVVGAGTVITRDLPENAVVVGQPARIVARLLSSPEESASTRPRAEPSR